MDADYAGSTIRQAYITMGTMFKAAKMNDLIAKHPMDGVRLFESNRVSDIKVHAKMAQTENAGSQKPLINQDFLRRCRDI